MVDVKMRCMVLNSVVMLFYDIKGNSRVTGCLELDKHFNYYKKTKQLSLCFLIE